MFINMDNPIILLSWGITSKTGCWHKGKKHKNPLLLYLLDGPLKMTIEDEVFSVNNGDILLIPQGTFYYPCEADTTKYYYFHFDTPPALPSEKIIHIETMTTPSSCRQVFAYQQQNPVININLLTHCATNPGVADIFKRLSKINVRQHPADVLMVNNLLRELLLTISTQLSERPVQTPKLTKIIQYIDINYNKAITLSDLSERFGVSIPYITKLFRNELNTSVVGYVHSVRISAACDLLIHTDFSIGEISAQVGFNHQHYFNHVFQEIHKMTPGQFRRSKQII